MTSNSATVMTKKNCYHRVVIKLGTNLLTGGSGRLDEVIMTGLVSQVAKSAAEGIEVVVVTSGAIAAGKEKLGLYKKTRDIPYRQVMASVGQSRLMNVYELLFGQHGLTVAQALLTRTDLNDRSGYLNARNTLLALMELGVITLVNENDVVAVDEIQEAKFGDNDNLSAMVVNLIEADLLLMLTDIDGLYDSDPRKNTQARLITTIEKITPEIEALAGGTWSGAAVGGMVTKLEAAKLASASGARVVIASGNEADVISRVIGGEELGTHFLPQSEPDARRRWLLSGLSVRGRIILDAGASEAVRRCGSLLPAGVTDAEGSFKRGDIVRLIDASGSMMGYGIVNYNAGDVLRIKGLHSGKISGVLGYDYGSEVIHRNNLAIC